MTEILIVDDDKGICNLMSEALTDEGYSVHLASTAAKALKFIERNIPDAILLDILLEGSHIDGMEILKFVKEKYPSIAVIMISGHADLPMIVKTIKMGAYSFINKPFKLEELFIAVKNAVKITELQKSNALLLEENIKTYNIVGKSKKIVKLINSINTIAKAHARILISGDAGTGKENIARIIHAKSGRAKHPFVLLRCDAFHHDAFDKELFGHEDSNGIVKVGLLEKAKSGTLCLNQVGDMPKKSQALLLNFLNQKRFQRIGGNQSINSDVRIIALTNKNLEEAVSVGEFNESLFYRLNVISIAVPNLAERKEDIPLLIEEFINEITAINPNAKFKITNETMNLLQSYDWPGNLRQLKNTIEWLSIMYYGKKIQPNMLPEYITKSSKSNTLIDAAIINYDFKVAKEIFEREYLLLQLKRFSNKVSKTANEIGMDRSALYRKLRDLEIEVEG